MRKLGLAIVLFIGCFCWGVPKGFAQASELDKGPAPPPPEEPAPAAPPKPQWDPLGAHKDLEVGSYYLKTDNYDAAIDRFQEAASLQPGLAEPFRRKEARTAKGRGCVPQISESLSHGAGPPRDPQADRQTERSDAEAGQEVAFRGGGRGTCGRVHSARSVFLPGGIRGSGLRCRSARRAEDA
jgi:hypothetical protein